LDTGQIGITDFSNPGFDDQCEFTEKSLMKRKLVANAAIGKHAATPSCLERQIQYSPLGAKFVVLAFAVRQRRRRELKMLGFLNFPHI
jgi:hypothetical protein